MTWHLFRLPVVSRKVEAETALQEAEERIVRVKETQEEVHGLAEDLRNAREANHFTDMIRQTMRRI